jgi:hypothetical protein
MRATSLTPTGPASRPSAPLRGAAATDQNEEHTHLNQNQRTGPNTGGQSNPSPAPPTITPVTTQPTRPIQAVSTSCRTSRPSSRSASLIRPPKSLPMAEPPPNSEHSTTRSSETKVPTPPSKAKAQQQTMPPLATQTASQPTTNHKHSSNQTTPQHPQTKAMRSMKPLAEGATLDSFRTTSGARRPSCSEE